MTSRTRPAVEPGSDPVSGAAAAGAPIFILACGRSGTTLLRSMLTCHSRIAVPRASHFIVEMQEKFPDRSLSGTDSARAAIDWLLEHERVHDFGIDRDAARRRMLELSEPSAARYCRVVFEEYARALGKARWGDKTTTYGPHAALLAEMFPDAQIVHLHRDGRDVVSSLLRVPFGSKHVVDATLSWKTTVNAIRNAGRRLGRGRFLELSYESLLEDPEAALTRLCDFLGERYEPGMLGYTTKVDELILPHDRPYHRMLAEHPSPDMAYRWKKEMAAVDRAIVERLAGRTLRDLGYEISGAKLGMAGAKTIGKRLLRRGLSRARRQVSSWPIPFRDEIFRSVRRGSDFAHPARLKAALSRPHDDVDVGRHLQEALDWICRAQDAGGDDGVARGVNIGTGVFQTSYPETTGYIIPTFLRASRMLNRSELHDRAVRMGEWEADIQMPEGAVMGGRVNPRPVPAVFNTGQVMLGWNDLYRQGAGDRFLAASRRAADWLARIQEDDGDWVAGHSRHAASGITIYNARVAWALCETGVLAGEAGYVESARRFVDFALEQQRENGWIARCCLTDAERPLLHTLAYAMRGFLETGILCDEPRYVDAARRTAEALATRIDAEGFLPGRFTEDWHGAVSWCCLTGSAQTSIVLFKLAHRTGDARLAERARTLNRYLMRRHDVTSPDPTLRGGVYGSWPVYGDYCRFEVINWGAKFLADALMEEIAAGEGAPFATRGRGPHLLQRSEEER